jgi:hypothetical protein
MAKTNNPSNFKVTYTGQWDACFSTKGTKTSKLGLAWITVTLKDTFSVINKGRIMIQPPDMFHFSENFLYHLDDSVISVVPRDHVKITEVNEDLWLYPFRA